MKKKVLMALSFFVMVLALPGCQQKADNNNNNPPAATNGTDVPTNSINTNSPGGTNQ